jgi:hypothetical protein
MISKPKKKNWPSGQQREKSIYKSEKRLYREADQWIGGQTLLRIVRDLTEIMEIDIPEGGAVRKLCGS